MRVFTGSVRGMVVALLAASGVLTIVASSRRWWPECPWGDYETPACYRAQDHLHDFVMPSEPWVPVGNAAQLMGAALVMLAVAAALLPWLLLRSRPWLALALSTVLGPTLLPIAVSAWLSGEAGEPMTAGPVTLAVLAWVLGWPAALITLASVSVRVPGITTSQRRAVLVLTTSLALTTPIAGLLVVPLTTWYVSHDTTPWSEAVTAAMLVPAAIAAWPATSRRRLTPDRELETQVA